MQHVQVSNLIGIALMGYVENTPKQDKSYLAQSYHHKPGERVQVCQNG
jgi:hypothetical protein